MGRAIKTTTYTNMDTGEICEKKDWVDTQFDEDGYLFWVKKASVKSFIENPLPQCFTWAERGRIQELKYYMLRDNQLLVYRSGDAIKPLGISEICRILNMSGRQCKSLVCKMKKYSIIKEVRYGSIKYFAFNPIYGFKGKRLTLEVYIMFQEELKNVLPKWVVQRFAKEATALKPNIEVLK